MAVATASPGSHIAGRRQASAQPNVRAIITEGSPYSLESTVAVRPHEYRFKVVLLMETRANSMVSQGIVRKAACSESISGQCSSPGQ